MVIKFFAICVHAFLFFGSWLLALLFAVNVSGTWAGSIDMRTADGAANRVAIRAAFTQHGTSVTGTFGPGPELQFPIDRGAVSGHTFTFRVAAPTRVARLTLTVVGDGRIQGVAVTEDGKAFGRVTLAREHDARENSRLLAPQGRAGRLDIAGSAARTRAHRVLSALLDACAVETTPRPAAARGR